MQASTEPPPPNNKSSPLGPNPPINWQAAIWYAGLMLWLWQDFGTRGVVRTIIYSDFKEYVRSKQVIECDIQDDAITGLIRLPAKPETKPANKPREDMEAANVKWGSCS